jgi:hypothetical protein
MGTRRHLDQLRVAAHGGIEFRTEVRRHGSILEGQGDRDVDRPGRMGVIVCRPVRHSFTGDDR